MYKQGPRGGGGVVQTRQPSHTMAGRAIVSEFVHSCSQHIYHQPNLPVDHVYTSIPSVRFA